jgi:predicted neuraminidase
MLRRETMTAYLESEMIFGGTKRYPSSHGSTIVETSEHDLLAAWYAGSREKGDDVVILSSKKDKGKADWRNPVVIADTPGEPEGNPVLLAQGGRILFFYQTIHGGGEGRTTQTTGWTTCDIKYRESLDDGESWGEDNPLRTEWGYVIRTKPLVVDGRILLPTQSEVEWNSLVMIGEEDGTRWRESNVIDTGEGFKKGNIEPALVELTDGRILMYMRSGSNSCIWHSISQDRGLNWSPPAPTDLPNPNSAIDLLRLRSGRIALAFNNTSQGRTPLTIALSDDDCQSWLAFRDIEDGPGEYSYPAFIQSSDDLIHLTYTYRREGIKHVTLEESWIEGA